MREKLVSNNFVSKFHAFVNACLLCSRLLSNLVPKKGEDLNKHKSLYQRNFSYFIFLSRILTVKQATFF